MGTIHDFRKVMIRAESVAAEYGSPIIKPTHILCAWIMDHYDDTPDDIRQLAGIVAEETVPTDTCSQDAYRKLRKKKPKTDKMVKTFVRQQFRQGSFSISGMLAALYGHHEFDGLLTVGGVSGERFLQWVKGSAHE